MATTDTRSGFRLPWISDRSQDSESADNGTEAAAADPAATGPAATGSAEALAWPASDMNTGLKPGTGPNPGDSTTTDSQPDVQEPEMIDMDPAPPPAPAAPRKTTKLMAELSAAIRATAEAARDQALAQVEASVAAVVEQIRAGSKEGEDLLRVRSDEDITRIKEWSRAEIARIKEETESRISTRKLGLDEELAAHAAAIEGRVGEVESAAAAFRADIESYTERLSSEDDPARLATMAESMPEVPVLDSLADLGNLELDLEAVKPADEDRPESAVETLEPDAPALEVAEAAEDETGTDTQEEFVAGEVATDGVAAEDEIVGEEIVAGDVVVAREGAVTDEMAAPDLADGFLQAEADIEPSVPAGSPWREADNAWGRSPKVAAEPETLEDDGSGAYTADADILGWDTGDVPEGTAVDPVTGQPVDRGEIMAALEAAAEAVVAAESAAESADQAEAAADIAETAAGMLKGFPEPAESVDPEAAAAMSARVDAGGFEESYTGRLASLLPNRPEGAADGEPRTTQVIVSGLVSVASIASFKRHLGRLAGVKSVAVASGPDGEFVFNVTHRPDVSFRDSLPTMPGFAARVTSTDDRSVHVTARDPEAEG